MGINISMIWILWNCQLRLGINNYQYYQTVTHSLCVFSAERFGKKLEELCRERGALKLGLPSRQPSVALFLERLRQAVHSALQRADCSQGRSVCQSDQQRLHGSISQTADTFLSFFLFLKTRLMCSFHVPMLCQRLLQNYSNISKVSKQ